MSHITLAAWRNLAGWLGTACLFLTLACLVDGSQAGGRKDPNLNELLPGQSLNLSGPMPRDAEKLEHLKIEADSPELAVKLMETYSGFWLGGQLWRAEVTVPGALASGDYALTLAARNETSPKNVQRFTLRVLPDQKALDAASLSLVKSRSGLSPFVLAAMLLPLGVCFGVVSTLLSRRLSALLRGLGLGQVFRAQKAEEGLRVSYNLGAQDGLAAGDLVEILDARGETVLFSVPAVAVRATDSDSMLPAGTRPPLNSLARKAARP